MQSLILRGDRITDDGVKQLQPLKQLSTLDLKETLVTDGCLPMLRNLPSLRWCYTGNTGVTEEGRTQIGAELPNLTFLY